MIPETIESESNEHSITQEIYDKLSKERIDEILEIRKKVNYKSSIYDFKGPTSSINFSKFGGPMYTYEKLKNGETTLQQEEKEQKDF